MLRLLTLLTIVAGLMLILRATRQYKQLLAYYSEETYSTHRRNRFIEQMCFWLLHIFIIGFVVGGIDVIVRNVEPIYHFVVLIFFLGALFIAVVIQVQAGMAISLREKNLEIMRTFVNAIDLKDTYTKGHSTHVYHIMQLLCERVAPDYKELNVPKLLDAALLHDIGKISISDGILNKVDPLTPEEWDIIKTHPRFGKYLLDDTCFREISDWVLYHHERMDGRGYYALRGCEIPLESRLIAIADTYSALCTNRAYRSRKTHAEAIAVMRSVAGTQLDATLLTYFYQVDADQLEALADMPDS